MIGIAVAIVATAAVTYLLTRGGQDTSESQAAPIEGTLTQLTSQPGAGVVSKSVAGRRQPRLHEYANLEAGTSI